MSVDDRRESGYTKSRRERNVCCGCDGRYTPTGLDPKATVGCGQRGDSHSQHLDEKVVRSIGELS
jgi:hypothetical protein